MSYLLEDLGVWEAYSPGGLPTWAVDASEIGITVGFSRRVSDHVDWYDFRSSLVAGDDVFVTVVRDPVREQVSAVHRDPSMIFPGNERLLRISGVDPAEKNLLSLFKGKLYDSALKTLTEPPPPIIPIAPVSDRQFAQVLAIDGKITQDEALAWAARGDLPDALENAIAQLPEAGGQRFAARMLLSAATSYDRAHPLVGMLGGLLGYDTAALDDLWRRGAAL